MGRLCQTLLATSSDAVSFKKRRFKCVSMTRQAISGRPMTRRATSARPYMEEEEEEDPPTPDREKVMMQDWDMSDKVSLRAHMTMMKAF